jgi:hypothetical protein
MMAQHFTSCVTPVTVKKPQYFGRETVSFLRKFSCSCAHFSVNGRSYTRYQKSQQQASTHQTNCYTANWDAWIAYALHTTEKWSTAGKYSYEKLELSWAESKTEIVKRTYSESPYYSSKFQKQVNFIWNDSCGSHRVTFANPYVNATAQIFSPRLPQKPHKSVHSACPMQQKNSCVVVFPRTIPLPLSRINTAAL